MPHRLHRFPASPLRAFTLIELLVVVAIIALLISILIPSLNGARKQARQLQCLTNLGSIGKASYFYQTEYKGWVIGNETVEGQFPKQNSPPGYKRDDSHAHTQFAISLLNGLLYDHPIKGLYRAGQQKAMIKACADTPQFQCPSHPNPKQKLDYIVNAFIQDYTKGNIEYDGTNKFRDQDFVEGTGVIDIAWWHHVDRFKVSQSDRIYIMEGHRGHHWLPPEEGQEGVRFHDAYCGKHLPWGNSPRIANDKRHPKGTNVLMFDSSARAMYFPNLDPGWPQSPGVRLRWFTTVPEKDR